MRATQQGSSQRKGRGSINLSPLNRHITEQKRNGLEIIMSANRGDGDQDNFNHDGFYEGAVRAMQDVILRSVGCQTKETRLA